MTYKGYTIKRLLLSVVYPNRCPFCGKAINHDKYFCRDCPDTLKRYNGEMNELFFADGAVSYCVYDDAATKLVLNMKFSSDGYALSAAAFLMSMQLSSETEWFSDIDGIVAVPMYPSDKRRRGYNQSELIAKEIAVLSGKTYIGKSLVKIRCTENQKELSAKERISNLTGAFSVKNKDMINGKKLLLIDDVVTTGSTMLAVCAALRKAGAEKVYCASFAKTARGT